MKFCTECGNKLSEGAKFCESCGTKVAGGCDNVPDVKQTVKECVEASPQSKIPLITTENLHIMLDEDQVERIVSETESLKEESESDRIHIVGEKDFDGFVNTFRAILKKRGVDGEVVEAAGTMSIALIDNGKSGLGKRGTLITRFGLIVLDQDVPNFENDAEIEGVIPWRLFTYFSAPYDSENYRLLDFKKLFSADEVDNEIKSEIKSGEADLMLRFGRTGLKESQIKDFVEFLKSNVIADVKQNADDDEGLANEEAQLEAEFDDEDYDETGMGEDDDID